eukprot:6027807-Ditylum_brightwellii.AAC.1
MSRLLIGDSNSGVYRGSLKMHDDGVDAIGERVAIGRKEENALVGAQFLLEHAVHDLPCWKQRQHLV